MIRRTASIVACLMFLSAAVHARPLSPDQDPVWIVGLASGANPASIDRLSDSVEDRIDELNVVKVRLPTGAAVALRGQNDVLWVERERDLHIFDNPNDPLLAKQWSFAKLKLERSWRFETGAKSPVTVAVADTGIDPSHPEFEGRLVPGFDFLANDEDPSDAHGHGTGVAGVIAATADNRTGIAGMSWGAKIMPLRVCDDSGACSLFAVMQGLVWAASHGARVVNLSLGGVAPRCARGLEAAAQYAQAQDTLLVAASGNSAQQGNPINYPSACAGFVAVGATDALDNVAPFSDHGAHLDLAAPGVGITTTWVPETSDDATPGYLTVDGTSFAAPHVSGLAALLISGHPDWTSEQVQQRMEKTAVDLGRKGHDRFYGHGRIDVVKAVRSR